MKSWAVVAGVPAAGHVTSGGAWHAGAVDSCSKCKAAARQRRARERRALDEGRTPGRAGRPLGEHGTASRYATCRDGVDGRACDECKAAHAARVDEFRKR